MAKAKAATKAADKAAATKTTEGEVMVNITMLSEQYGVEGKKVRQALRGAGMKAPEIKGVEGFGPRAKYEWAAGSKELKEVHQVLEAAFAETEGDEKE